MVGTIAIRNPKILEMVADEVRNGGGRNMVEAAENLIVGEALRRKMERESKPSPQPARDAKPSTAVA